MIMKKKDLKQAAKELADENNCICGSILSMVWSLIFSLTTQYCPRLLEIFNMVRYCIEIISMYYIALGYAYCSGICIAIEWYFTGLDIKGKFGKAFKACSDQNPAAYKHTNNEDLFKEFSTNKHGTFVLIPIERPMPWGELIIILTILV